MSHASVLIALSPEDAKVGLEQAIEFQMEPFNEDGDWFKDGSRWDWYVVGGRYTGRLSGYDPESDPRNYATCWLCHGTGTRPDMTVKNGCNGCSGTGTARNFHNAKHDGDIQIKKNVDLERIQEVRLAQARRTYEEALAKGGPHVKLIYDVDPSEEPLEQYLQRCYGKPEQAVAHYAFLANRHWHEAERLGWFGGHTATECEIKAREAGIGDVDEMIRRCKHKDEKTGASLVVWNEPWELWSDLFWKRFVEPLSPETVLVTVDYHV